LTKVTQVSGLTYTNFYHSPKVQEPYDLSSFTPLLHFSLLLSSNSLYIFILLYFYIIVLHTQYLDVSPTYSKFILFMDLFHTVLTKCSQKIIKFKTKCFKFLCGSRL
jgi:hypothetical protein